MIATAQRTPAPAPKLSLMWFQRAIVLCTAPMIFFAGGRGVGKTETIEARIKYLTTRYAGFRCMYVSPIFSQGHEVYKKLCADLHFRAYIDFKRTSKRPFPLIVLRNGSQIWFRNFQRPDNVRSTGEDEVIIDESQDPCFTEDAVNTVLIPLIGRRQSPAGGRGTFFLAGQFRGEDWRYEKYFMPGQRPNQNIYKSWRIPSSEGYAYRTPGGRELLELRRQTTRVAVWEQEWDCLPRANANAAFSSDSITKCTRAPWSDTELLAMRNARGRNIQGTDMGRIVDPTKLVVLHSVNSRLASVIDAQAYPLKQEHSVSALQASQNAASFHASMVVDATGGATGGHAEEDSFVKLYRENADRLNVNLKEFFWSHHNKKRIIDQLALSLQQGEILIPENCEGLLKELKAYEYRFNEKTKVYVYGAPKGQHDDYVSGLAMGQEGVKRGWFQTINHGAIGAFRS